MVFAIYTALVNEWVWLVTVTANRLSSSLFFLSTWWEGRLGTLSEWRPLVLWLMRRWTFWTMQWGWLVINLCWSVLIYLFAPLNCDWSLMEDFADDMAGLKEVLEVREIWHLGVLEVHQWTIFVFLLEGAVEGPFAFRAWCISFFTLFGCCIFSQFFWCFALRVHQGNVGWLLSASRWCPVINRSIMSLKLPL